MSFSSTSPRRPRRRKTFWLAAIGSVVVLLGLLAFRFIDDRTKVMDFVDSARDAASTYEALAVRADVLIEGLEDADRPALLAVLDETELEAAAAENSLLEAEVPSDLSTAAGFLTIAVSVWRDGLAQLDSGVRLLLEDPSDVNGVASLSSAFLDFRVGDQAYRQFALLIADTAGERPFPNVEFITAEREPRFDAQLVADRLVALDSLAADHDIAVADIRFDPAPTGDREGRAVIPFSPTLNLEVSVFNRGNEPEVDIPVRLRLISLTGDIIFDDSRTIEALDPGAAVNLLFPDLPVQPGEFYEVLISADLATDEDPSSNEESRSFYRNDST